MKPIKISTYCSSLYRTTSTYGHFSNPKLVNKACSGKDNFEKDFEKSHIQTNAFQKILLGLGSGLVSITSPSRGDMIAVMGEITGPPALEYMLSKMNKSEEGRKILEDKPRISSGSIDLSKLKTYPEGTLGKAYSNFLGKYGYTPDTRNAVQFVDDIELAYIAQRYREVHDLIHTLLDMPTNMLGEVTVKWVEAIQFKLPMCATGALFGAVRLAPKCTRSYSTKSVIQLDEALVKSIESNVLHPKHHPGVMKLPRVCLPENILAAIRQIVIDVNRTVLVREAEEFKKQLYHRVLPMEKDTQRKLYAEFYRYYTSKIQEDIEEDDKLKNKIESQIQRKLKSVSSNWRPIKYDKRTSLKYLLARGAGDYAVLKRVLYEIFKRDKEFAPKSLMDFGSGIGTVNWVAYEYWGKTLNEYYCVDASGHMNELAALILKGNNPENEPFIKDVYYRQFFPATPRLFDIVVSAYSFFDFSNSEERLKMLTCLWNNTKEYLVLVEKGCNWGFKVIVEARDFILEMSKKYDVDCYVFAPCPHDLSCPRLYAEGKKIPCNFVIDYQKISFSKSDDTVTENFCFVILRKRKTPEEDDRQCRVVKRVLKRSRHAVCTLCTNKGDLNTIFVTSSKHGKPAYQCMRASHWGDLIPGKVELKKLEAPSMPLISNDKELIPDYKNESPSNIKSDDDDYDDDGDDGDDNNNNNNNNNSKNN